MMRGSRMLLSKSQEPHRPYKPAVIFKLPKFGTFDSTLHIIMPISRKHNRRIIFQSMTIQLCLY